jgi:hypothetical protein
VVVAEDAFVDVPHGDRNWWGHPACSSTSEKENATSDLVCSIELTISPRNAA